MINQFKLVVNKELLPFDGYSTPLVCKGGLMYLELQGIPTDKDLQTYPPVYLTSPHEWDRSVLDYELPEHNGEPDWAIDPNETFSLIPILMNLVIMSIDHYLYMTYYMKHLQFHQFITYWFTNMYFNGHQLIMKS